MAAGSDSVSLRRVRVYACMACIAGLSLSGLAAWHQIRANEALTQARFDGSARQLVERLVSRLGIYENGLRAARGSVISVGEDAVSRRSFGRYAATRSVEHEFPGAHGFGFIRRVPVAYEAAFTLAARRDGMPDFAIRQLTPHSAERYVIQYIEPLDRNREAVGLDVASEAARRDAAQQSMRTGTATLTAPITLVQATAHRSRGFLLLLPICRPDTRHDTAEARERATFGWAYAPLVIDEILQSFDFESLSLAMDDVSHGAPPQPFFASTEAAPVGNGPHRRLLRNVFGRTWAFEVRARPRFLSNLNLLSPRRVFEAGALSALLLAGLVYTYLVGRLRAQQILTQASRMAMVLENSRDAIVSVALDGSVTSWNGAAEQIFGYTSESALGRALDDLIGCEETHDTVATVVARIERGAVTSAFDAELRCSNGTRIDVSIVASPVTSSAKQILGVGLTIRDISERKAAERQLANFNAALSDQVAERTRLLDDARRHLEQILDALPSMIGYWNKDLINGFGNRAYTTWFGLAAGELIGKHIRDVLGEGIFELNRGHIEAALRGEPQTFERTIPQPGGLGVRHALAHYLPDVVDGQVRGFYALVHDVSDLTESRLQLAAAARENDALLKTLDRLALVSMTDRSGKITYVNQAFCEISGYSREELLGKDHRLINSGTHPRGFWSDVWRTIGHGTPWRGEVCNRAKDGSLYWVDSMIAPSVDENGKIDRYISIRTDITSAKRAVLDLREASKALEALAQQLKAAQRISQVGSWEFDVATGRVVWSEELYRIMGMDPGGPAPDLPTQQSLFTVDSWAQLVRLIQRAVDTGEGYEVTLDVLRDNAEQRNTVARGEALRDASGAVCRLVGTLQDTTERERAAQTTRELSTRLQLATSAAGMGVWDWNLRDNALVWDETMHQLYGVPSDEPVEYDVWRAALHPNDAADAIAALQAAVSSFGEYTPMFRILGRDGEIKHLRAAAVVQRDAAGQAQRVVGVNWDITEQRVAEIALRSSEVLQRTILAHAGSAIIATDRAGVITLWNYAAEALLGYSAAEVVHIETPALIHDPAEVEARRVALLAEHITIDSTFDVLVAKTRSGVVDTNEWTYLRKDGSRVSVLLTVSCLRDATGEIFGYLGVAADLSARKQQESELKELNRLLVLRGEQAEAANTAKSMFLANTSHEIRTPINAVIGLTYLLEKSQLNAEQRALVIKVKLASRALLDVINDVLDLSKIEAGELALEAAPFELSELLLELESTLGASARSKGLELIVRKDAAIPAGLVGDVTRVRQILLNLLGNAIKFTDKGSVELAVRCEALTATRVEILCSVRDSGIGIAPEVQARIFAPFTQADASTTRRFGGTGLGLSIVRQLAELMGGEVGLESDLGLGSEFWVKLSLGVVEPTGKLDAAPTLEALIAARDAHERSELTAMMEALGWRVEAVAGVDALTQLLTARLDSPQPFAILLVDRQLLRLDDTQTLSVLAQKIGAERMPATIVVNSVENEPIATPHWGLRVDSVLAKPLTVPGVFNAVEAALARGARGLDSHTKTARAVRNDVLLLPDVRILVVDDSDVNREVARSILALEGAVIQTTENGALALELLRRESESFDLVLMDVQMPVMDGLEATRCLRAELGLAHVPVIALTAGALSTERQRALDSGMNAFVTKPFDPRALVEVVRHEIARVRGTPVAVRARELVTRASEPSWPAIEGIDREAVGPLDVTQFMSLLQLFFNEFADLAQASAFDLHEAKQRERCCQRVHKLRGSAGVLGATNVHLLAGVAERALRDKAANIDEVAARVRQLGAALGELHGRASPVLLAVEANAAQRLHVSPPPESDAIHALWKLLHQGDFIAHQRFGELADALGGLLGPKEFAQLRDAVESYRFADAAALLEACIVAA